MENKNDIKNIKIINAKMILTWSPNSDYLIYIDNLSRILEYNIINKSSNFFMQEVSNNYYNIFKNIKLCESNHNYTIIFLGISNDKGKIDKIMSFDLDKKIIETFIQFNENKNITLIKISLDFKYIVVVVDCSIYIYNMYKELIACFIDNEKLCNVKINSISFTPDNKLLVYTTNSNNIFYSETGL